MAKEETTKEAPMANEAAKDAPEADETAKTEAIKEPTFSGSQLIRAATGVSRDIMAAALSPDKQYTEAEAKSIIDKFLKKEVIKDGRGKLDNSK